MFLQNFFSATTHGEPHPSWLLILRLNISLLGTITSFKALVPDSILPRHSQKPSLQKGGPRNYHISCKEDKNVSSSLVMYSRCE